MKNDQFNLEVGRTIQLQLYCGYDTSFAYLHFNFYSTVRNDTANTVAVVFKLTVYLQLVGYHAEEYP